MTQSPSDGWREAVSREPRTDGGRVSGRLRLPARTALSPRGIVWEQGGTVALLWSMRTPLWVVAVVFFGVGDAASTAVGMDHVSLTEVNPVLEPLVRRHGLAVMSALKLGFFAVCAVLWRRVPRPINVGIPLGLAALGLLTTGWNVLLILSVT